MTTRQQWTILLICATWLTFSIKSHLDNRDLHQQIEAQRQYIDQREALIDSLHAELFISSTIIGRTELTLEYLNQTNPKAFIQFSQYYDHETE
jgi:hypothetical protein